VSTLLALDLTGRPVLVAGGGPTAASWAGELARDGAVVQVAADRLCEDLADLVAAGVVRWDPELPADLAGAWLVVAATGDRDQDDTLAAQARERGVFCLAPAGGGTAQAPAVSRHEGLALAVHDPDPARARRVRDALALRIDEGGLDLRGAHGGGRVTLVGGGPGREDLLTVAGLRALAAADVVVADRLGPRSVLDRLPADVEVVDVGKKPGHHPVPQDEINAILVERARRGAHVVRLKGGDPFVLGRGGEEVLACRAAGVPVAVVPGISSALAVPAAAGIPVTHRGTATAFHVTTGHDGFDEACLAALVGRTATVVVLMGVVALPGLVAAALAAGADPGLPVAAVQDGTLASQQVTRTTLARAVREFAHVRAPAVLVFGDVAALDLPCGAVADEC
jgi:uroporphyrin-III C-methyltransferase/precorrin-2 dehydrogenase/sirohydrochlorin ferrochelatase